MALWCILAKKQETNVENVNSAVETLIQSSNTLFILMGAIMVFAMHAGFAFLEVGTVRHKNQVNALVKILTDFGFSAMAYFFVGYWVAYGVTFFSPAAFSPGMRSLPFLTLSLPLQKRFLKLALNLFLWIVNYKPAT